ncbi:AI-2E family transporter [Trujillonella humicola]|uniref:AI-2E family transporter n=1 Tax=Trujillonella humicola TaxID=3383699 RepID=UPI0039069A81
MRLLPSRRSGSGAAPDNSPHALTDVPGATTSAPAPSDDRGPRLQRAVRTLAIGSAELLLIVLALYVVGEILGALWVILLPIVLGLLITTVLWPPARFLRRHGWPPALAAATVVLLAIGGFGGLIAAIAPQVVDQVEELAGQVASGLEDIQAWLQGPPFNIDEDQIGNAVDNAINELQARAGDIAGYAATGATAIGNGLINLVLALVLCFFFLKDGPRWVPWLAAQTGRQAAPHVAALSAKVWSTLSEFIRQQALVGFVDAFFIGLGLWILDVPLVLPLAVITFFAAFIPIIGAVVAGAFAVLVALVDQGFGVALAVLILVLVVQQLESNVLQPIIQGRGFNMHPAVVILAVTAGGSLAGITGAFLGVPVAALTAVIYRYVRDALDGRSPEVTDEGARTRVVGDEDGAALAAEHGPPPTDRGPAPEEDARS